MSTRPPFGELLADARARSGGSLCVGLDPDPARMPDTCQGRPGGVHAFLAEVIAATQDLVCAYKPNLAFFEALGVDGWRELRGAMKVIPKHIPIILDAKRGDIGSSSEFYARAVFDQLGADAVTVNPMMGTDSILPFLERRDRGVFALCLTSNPGAAEFIEATGLHTRIAAAVPRWREVNPHVGLVVGATRPEALAEIRGACPEAEILLPGVGAQAGDLEAALTAGRSPSGLRLIVNASRAILYASTGPDFPAAARAAAITLRDRTRHDATGA